MGGRKTGRRGDAEKEPKRTAGSWCEAPVPGEVGRDAGGDPGAPGRPMRAATLRLRGSQQETPV